MTIKTKDGDKKIRASWRGNHLALHRPPDEELAKGCWNLTHIDSGLAMMRFGCLVKRKTALDIAQRLDTEGDNLWPDAHRDIGCRQSLAKLVHTARNELRERFALRPQRWVTR